MFKIVLFLNSPDRAASTGFRLGLGHVNIFRQCVVALLTGMKETLPGCCFSLPKKARAWGGDKKEYVGPPGWRQCGGVLEEAYAQVLRVSAKCRIIRLASPRSTPIDRLREGKRGVCACGG